MCVCEVEGWVLAEIVVSSINNGRQNSDGHIAPLIYDQTERTVLLSDYKSSHVPCIKHTHIHTQISLMTILKIRKI